MSKQVGKRILQEISRSGARSSLFWWMVEHHDWIVASASGARFSWERLCPEFEELGLRDARGMPASKRTARETWRQARIAVEKARAIRAAAVDRAPKASPETRVTSIFAPSSAPASPPGASDSARPSAGGQVPVGASSTSKPPGWHWSDDVEGLTPERRAKLREQDRKINKLDNGGDLLRRLV